MDNENKCCGTCYWHKNAVESFNVSMRVQKDLQ